MGRGSGRQKGGPPMGPPGEDMPPYNVRPPGWGPPPPGGWGPTPPDHWRPPPPEWDLPPPGGWGPPPPGGWGAPPGDWGPRGPPHPDWGPRGPPPPGWGPHPDDWRPPPDDWRRQPVDWGDPYYEEWRLRYEEYWRQRHLDEWGPDRPPPPEWGPPPPGWGPPEPVPPIPHPSIPPAGLPPPAIPPPGLPPLGLPPPGLPPPVLPPPPVTIPPPDPAAFPPPVPPFAFPPAFPAASWAAQPIPEEPMLNPPPDQPQWIKALISAPPTDSTPAGTETSIEASPASENANSTTSSKSKPEPNCTSVTKALGLLGKRKFEKPPPGRSTGMISSIEPQFGYVEKENLEKYRFCFDAFFGSPKAMVPGVRVHFTACKDQSILIATDVKVAPGGTENVDAEIFEAVVSQVIRDPKPGERYYPGQVHVNLRPLKTNLSFERQDSTVTLLRHDQVLINILTDIVTEKRRATNIKPKIPATFARTKETREEGVIISLEGDKGVIKSEKHGELPFNIRENFSDVEFTAEDINEEVEFTVHTLSSRNEAIRIQRVKESLLLTLELPLEDTPKTADTNGDSDLPLVAGERNEKLLEPANMQLDKELYEGVISQPVIDPTPTLPGFPGQIYANIGPLRTHVTFDHGDCGVTLLKNDHVLINVLVDSATKKKRAANIKPKIPFTFSYTKEKRELGVITSLGPQEGIVKSDEHGELRFDLCENFSDTEFSSSEINDPVEFTSAIVKFKKRAIRLRRMKMFEDKILMEQKRRQEEKKQLEAKTEEVDEERKRKEEVAAALAAAKDKWTPLGFTVTDPCTLDEVSKERFNGTILKAIFRNPQPTKREPAAEEKKACVGIPEVKVKTETMVVKEEEESKTEAKLEVKEEEVEKKVQPVLVKTEPQEGRLVMTVEGQQKHLFFTPKDLLTTATMLVGDKVRFNIATNPDTKEERATYVEILPDSFVESTEQRRQGIVIEFLTMSGVIKCSQNPQLFFYMTEVMEKKRLELNEKVEFSVVPHETAEGGTQAIRIKRFTENVFLPVRKLVGVGTSKGKMTIKLTQPLGDTAKVKPETDKLKAVVKSLRAQDSRSSVTRRDSSSRKYVRGSRSKSRSRSRSPVKDQFGRIKRKRSTTPERDRKSSWRRRSKDRSRRHSSRSRSRSKSSSRSRSRSREKDRKSRKVSKEREERQERDKRRREQSPPHRRVVDDELARKKRELEELNEMIAYKKSLVDVDPRGLDPGHRTCIDYDHGRITMPVRSILKKRPEGPEYQHRPPYDDPYYDRAYSSYQDRRYGEPYGDPYAARSCDPPYSDRPYEGIMYSQPSSASQRYTDRYDVYDQPYDDRYYERPHPDQPYRDQQRPATLSPEPRGPSPSSQSAASTEPHSSAASLSQATFKPLSPSETSLQSTHSSSPKRKPDHPSPPVEKPPLDRFLDMLSNKKADVKRKSEQSHVNDDLLPHERALQDGGGFSRLVGMSQEHQSHNQAPEEEAKQQSPKCSSVERTSDDPKSKLEPYDKIQSLLRSIGLKLSSGDVSKLAIQAQEKPIAKEDSRMGRTGSVESDRIPNPQSLRSSSVELPGKQKAASPYEEFLNQQELEALRKVQQLQSLTKTIASTSQSTTAPKPPPGPPPAQYIRPPPPINWPLGGYSSEQTSTATKTEAPTPDQLPQRIGIPPGPPPGPPPRRPTGQSPPGPPRGPPPRRPAGQPPFAPPASLAALGQPLKAPPPEASPPPVANSTVTQTPSASGPITGDQATISTTMARCLKVIETVKSLAVQPPTKSVKSVQFCLPTEAPAGSSPETTADTEDDARAKQKAMMDLFSQKLLERREQQYQGMMSRKKPEKKEAPGKPETKNVWICGHSLVYWAESRAKSPEVGMQLGMDLSKVAIWWKGIQGMTWSQLLPQLHQLKITWPNPDVLIIHLGGNDLSTDSPTDLLASVKKDLASIRSIFPKCTLVWSNILPRRAWRHSPDIHEVDLVRSTVNRRIHIIISDLGGTSLTHDNIRCGTNTGLYRTDGIHLSPKGIDVFNQNLQDFLEKWEMEVNKED